MSKIELMLGDCVERMKDTQSESIDLTVTSPPYDNLRAYNGNNALWGEHVWKSVLQELFRVTKQGGVVVWVVGDATIKGSETGTSFKQALYAKECGFNLHDTMIWNKGSFTAVGSLQTRYAPTWEYMFVWSKGKPETFNPIKDRKNKTAGSKISGTIRKADGTIRPFSGAGKISQKYGIRFGIWNVPPEKSNKKRVHPAQMCEQIANDHIISWSNEGDTVLDPFMGSGTTGKMAILNNRDFIGIELDEEYFEIAKNRINNHVADVSNMML